MIEYMPKTMEALSNLKATADSIDFSMFSKEQLEAMRTVILKAMNEFQDLYDQLDPENIVKKYGDHVQKAKFYYDRDNQYSGMSFHIKKVFYAKGESKAWFCSRYYATYDRPDWTYFFTVDEKEANDIVNAGYATYWNKKEDVFG